VNGRNGIIIIINNNNKINNDNNNKNIEEDDDDDDDEEQNHNARDSRMHWQLQHSQWPPWRGTNSALVTDGN
jgi:hypothetical protein